MNSELKVIPVETDVLIIGGGLAGCMAGIKAAESELSVTIAEKANTLRSGCAGSGIDHIWAYIPPIHEKMGWSMDDLMEDHTRLVAHGFINKDLLALVAGTSYDRVMDLEQFGVTFRYEDSPIPGKFRIVHQFHAMPSSFNFDGRDIKYKLTAEAQRRGVRIMNRIMVTDLLVSDGRIAGALGVGTRTGDIYFFRAKAVVLSSGRANRLTRNAMGVDFNLNLPPHLSGDGKAMALQAGVEIVNMEFLEPRGFGKGVNQPSSGFPRNTFQPAGAVVDHEGKTLVPRTEFFDWKNYDKKPVDAAAARKEFASTRFLGGIMPPLAAMHARGEGPFYLDLTKGNEEEIKYIEWSLGHEGKCWLFRKHLREQGVDFSKDKIEIHAPSSRNMRATASAGLRTDKNLETAVKGLFAAGDEVSGLPFGSAPGALTMGWHAGGMAMTYAAGQSGHLPADEHKLEALMDRCNRMLTRKDGDQWKEVELAVQNLMDFYRGDVCAEPLLKRGLERLDILRRDAPLQADSPHELFRCLEVQSIMENAEMVMRASLERKESRKAPFRFVRSDYPDQDDSNYKAFLALRKEGEAVKFRKVPIHQ
ncbi:MAG: FAD-dependent oxidoreductase [Deltaproteobacteria bacterium]|nr:FAD-dependent oxidoreductase [Deltaproteobacteria bacterium]